MIELLVKYIQDKGFSVAVFPGVLSISKEAKGQLFNVGWAIFKADLRPDFEEVLYYEATQRMDEIDQAIASYQA